MWAEDESDRFGHESLIMELYTQVVSSNNFEKSNETETISGTNRSGVK